MELKLKELEKHISVLAEDATGARIAAVTHSWQLLAGMNQNLSTIKSSGGQLKGTPSGVSVSVKSPEEVGGAAARELETIVCGMESLMEVINACSSGALDLPGKLAKHNRAMGECFEAWGHLSGQRVPEHPPEELLAELRDEILAAEDQAALAQQQAANMVALLPIQRLFFRDDAVLCAKAFIRWAARAPGGDSYTKATKAKDKAPGYSTQTFASRKRSGDKPQSRPFR